MGVRADIVGIAKATVGHIIRYITGGGAVNEMPNRQYLDFSGNCTVQDDGTGIKVTIPEVPAGSVTVGNVTTLPPGDMAYVTNIGTPIHAILNFGVPVGQEPPASDTSLGITRLSDSVNSSSNAATGQTAASPLSVKIVNDALTALDTAAVHKSGAETITGAKTFSEAITGNLTGNVSGNAGTATKLETARSLQTNLASSTAVTFDGSADQNAIPVTGVLPVANGGTGSNTQNFVDLTTAQTIAGVKTFSNDIILANSATIADEPSFCSFGVDDNGGGSRLYIIRNAAGDTYWGLRARNYAVGGTFKDLIGTSNSILTWGGSKVLTGADVIEVRTGPAVGVDFTLPSGGTWKYFFSALNTTTSVSFSESGAAAGGTNITTSYPAASHVIRGLAIKVAD